MSNYVHNVLYIIICLSPIAVMMFIRIIVYMCVSYCNDDVHSLYVSYCGNDVHCLYMSPPIFFCFYFFSLPYIHLTFSTSFFLLFSEKEWREGRRGVSAFMAAACMQKVNQ